MFDQRLALIYRKSGETFNEILDVVNNYVRSIDEDNRDKVVEKIGRIARWEFEGYKPYQPEQT